MENNKQIEEMVANIDAYIEGVDVRHWYSDELDERLAEYLYNAGYRKAAEIAEEIISDAKATLLSYHSLENKKYLKSLSKTKKEFDIKTARYRAITDAVKFAIETLDELKNKWTEGEGCS